jgi:uncharacterized protein
VPRLASLGPLVVLPVCAACGGGAPVVAPLGAATTTCAAEGCGAAAQPDASAIRETEPACPALADGTCGASQPGDCTERALSTWAELHDDRQLPCVAAMFERACSLDDARACSFAGRLWLDGRGVPRDVERGLQMLVRACDEGVAMACAVGARWAGEPLHASDTPDAPELLARLEAQRTCLLGQGDACLQVGLLFYFGREAYPRDRARAASAFARGCDAGDARACSAFGRSLTLGDGLARSPERAAAVLAKACKFGDGLGCSTLGLLSERGDGVPRDAAKARALYRDGCIAGDIYGCLHADMLASDAAGHGAARRYARWSAACARGDASACAFVGMLYEDGADGALRDDAKSLEWMQRACDTGEPRACEWIKSRPEE